MQRMRQIITDSAVATIDTVVSSVPGLNIAWGVAQAILSSGLKLRQERALEWVEMIRDNSELFTQDKFNRETFQDCFVYALEKYITERDETKRMYARNIFLHLAEIDDISDFPLERLYLTLGQLSPRDIETLSDVSDRIDSNYQVYGTTNKNIENIYSLIQVGVLRENGGSHTIYDGFPAPFVNLSGYGKEFIKYINRN